MYGAGSFPSMGSSAWQPYWEAEYCVVVWELMCFPANVHLKNNNFTSHEDRPWSHGQQTQPNTLLSCSFLCTPINTSPICIEAICIFGKIPQCWHKSTLYPPPPLLLPPPLSPNSFFPLLNLSLPEREKEEEWRRRKEKWRETGSKRSVSKRPPRSLSHYGIHQSPHIHSASKGLLSCKEGVWLNWGCLWIGGWDWVWCSIFGSHVSITGMVLLFFKLRNWAERWGVEGQGVLFFLGGGLEIFQTVPFWFQRKLHLCKCALCPLAYCLNSIVDFCGKLTGVLGA